MLDMNKSRLGAHFHVLVAGGVIGVFQELLGLGELV